MQQVERTILLKYLNCYFSI